ncbi:pesticin C-terminus-like muramidase [Glaciecola siphonariae]|uniref:Pesticin C-terminus-like muramidase n=1 Tax=Glaciecola siphonariae TaxID=521012 RepID=A0ABV9LZW5_9ALTE
MGFIFPDQRINIDFDFIGQLEGKGLLNGYVPDANNSKSGVTIATGFDLGARNVHDLKSLGLSASLIEKLSPYLGYQGREALEILAKQPLYINEIQAAVIDEAVKYQMTKRVIELYNEHSQIDFAVLPARWQTVISSVAFQYGNLAKRCPRFFEAVITQDWEKAISELRDFGDNYSARRLQEADYATLIQTHED